MNTYHRIYALVDLSAIKENIMNIKNSLPSSLLVMPVVKADAYGHGAISVANKIDDVSDYFGVATIEEALELRQNGINKPILILGTLSSRHFDEAVLNDITVNVYTEEMAQKLSKAASDSGKKARMHIALDTGMNRIGLSCDDKGIELFKKIISYPNLIAEGIFSHYATADEEDKTKAICQQKRFDGFILKLRENGIDLKLKHICNSAASADLNDKCYSMIRPGIIIYGLYPSEYSAKNLELKSALQLKSHISYIKKVPKGEGISYGRTYVTDSERIIATVPVGYADGYPRLLSNKGRVIVKGKYAPIVGRVCMDQFMIDITGIDGVNTEDTVTLIGRDGESEITADEIASICNTINYEIVCGIGKRVPRVYTDKE